MIDPREQTIGEAWLTLTEQLEIELRERDPEARVTATIDPYGLLAFEVRTSRRHRAEARALAQRYEQRAQKLCEHCGGSMRSVGAGAVVTVLCPGCTTEGQ